MKLNDIEYDTFLAALRKFKKGDSEVIDSILAADFAVTVDYEDVKTKNELNSYKKEMVLYALLYPYAKMFFLGNYDIFNSSNELYEFLKEKLGRSYLGSALKNISDNYES